MRGTPVAIAILLAVTLAVWSYPTPAYAYLDLGTGSMMLQVAVASVMAGLFTLKMYWRKLRSWFGFGPAEPELTAPSADEEPAAEVERGTDR